MNRILRKYTLLHLLFPLVHFIFLIAHCVHRHVHTHLFQSLNQNWLFCLPVKVTHMISGKNAFKKHTKQFHNSVNTLLPGWFIFFALQTPNERQLKLFYMWLFRKKAKPRACTVGMPLSQPDRSCSEPLLSSEIWQKPNCTCNATSV